jgi:hypothetical protein
MACRGPALFIVFAGSPAPAAGIAPHLSAAAACESRVFPTFCHDAAAGANWAARFTFAGHRQTHDWPVASFERAKPFLQRRARP